MNKRWSLDDAKFDADDDGSMPESRVGTLRRRTGHMAKKLGTQCKERCCTVGSLKRRFPITVWLPKYSLTDLEGDIVAGVTVALTVIPQGLALAVLADLPPQYGLYTAFMGCFMYTLFGSCKDLTIGPTAIMSLMTAEHVHKGGATYAVILSFICGILQLAMGFLNLGFLVNFISGPVISGFTSAAAITIAVTQLKGLFGLKFHSEGFIPFIKAFFENIHKTNLYDMAMGLTCVFLLLLIRQFKDKKFPENSRIPSRVRQVLEKSWFMFATGRNAIIVLICAGIAVGLLNNNSHVLTLTKSVQSGLPPFHFPNLTLDIYDNITRKTTHQNFGNILQDLGSGVIIIPLLSILEAIAIAKAFAKGKKLDATQEMIALGVCNFMGAFVSAYPSTGSFSRTAINNNSGVRTPMSGIFTGCIVILALSTLAPYFKYLPNASLSAIIFTAVIFMVHYQDVPLIWRTNKWDLVPLLCTFIGSFLLGLEFGILLGVGTSLMILLYQQARPSVHLSHKQTSEGDNYLLVKPDRSVFFPSVEYVKEKINKAIPDDVRSYALVYDGINVTGADYTFALGMKNMIDTYVKNNITTIFINLKPNVCSAIEGARPEQFHYCATDREMESLIHSITKRSLSNGKIDLLESKLDIVPSIVGSPSVDDEIDYKVSGTSSVTAANRNTTSPLLHGKEAGQSSNHDIIETENENNSKPTC